MRASKYNFWSETPAGHPLLFNGRTGALVQLDNPTEDEFVRAALDGDPNELVPELVRLGFLWDDDSAAEIEAILARRGEAGSTSAVLEVTISPTYGCNFRCTYCYVQFDERRMSDQTETTTLAYLQQSIPRHPQTNVTWFGGEPLLAWRRVARMAAAIQQIGEHSGRRVEQFLTTNGYLLSDTVTNALVDAGIRWVHVTIDGCGDGQDTRRVLRNGVGTYERVLHNLVRTLQDHPSVGGTLRMNLEPDSIALAKPLLESIPIELRPRIQVHPTPVILEGIMRDDQFLHDVAGVVTDALRLGYAYYDNDIPVKRQFHCGAEGSHNFQIGPDGTLHKCSPSGKPEVTVGRIDTSGKASFNANARAWTAAHDLPPVCKECPYLCFCQGGCRLDRIRHQRDPRCRDQFIAMRQHVLNRWLASSLVTRPDDERGFLPRRDDLPGRPSRKVGISGLMYDAFDGH